MSQSFINVPGIPAIISKAVDNLTQYAATYNTNLNDRSSMVEKSDLTQYIREGDTSSFSDYDILKNIVGITTTRSNSEMIASNLLNMFGDLNHVLSASPRRLDEAQGVSRKLIVLLKLFEATGHRMAQARIVNRPILDNWTSLLEYLYSTSSHLRPNGFGSSTLTEKTFLYWMRNLVVELSITSQCTPEKL